MTDFIVFDTPLGLMALEAEMRNADICDYTVDMTTPEAAAKEIIKGLQL
jgi:hypothetical protein